MRPLPQLETCLRLAFEARDPEHPSGISLSSYFLRAPTRGRRRAGLSPGLLFPDDLRAQVGEPAIELAMDAGSFRGCPQARPLIPSADRRWLAEAALSLARAEGFSHLWALLRAMGELEMAAQQLLGPRAPRPVVRQVLNGVSTRGLRVEPFAALSVRVLKIAQAVYAAFRHSGREHAQAWAAVEERLWQPHPTGERTSSGAEARGAYLPSLVQAASGNARRRLRRNTDSRRTQEHAGVLLARFVSGPGTRLWPWSDAEGRPLPEPRLEPSLAGLAFFVLLTHTASERRSRGGTSRGLSTPFADAGFAAADWLPDRTDDVAVRLLTASDASEGAPRGELLDAFSVLLRATLAPPSAAPDVARTLQRLGVDVAQGEAEAMITRAAGRLPALLRWLEENARELLELG